MALENSYKLEFAYTPFVSDVARIVRMAMPVLEQESEDQLPPEKHQPEADLLDEINRLLPPQYLQDFCPPSPFPGRNLSAVAQQAKADVQPARSVRVGDWYYPTGAGRWSVFRGLATSSQVKAMLAATGGSQSATLTMMVDPLAPNKPDSAPAIYTVTTSMRMLPPRPLGETRGFDGLYLVTLVDSRYWFQGTPVTLHVNQNSTWDSLLTDLASALVITLTYDPIDVAYGKPEPDSQLWSTAGNAAVLLDAVALNVGRIVVRKLDGTFTLLSPTASQTIVDANRGLNREVVRLAGGEMFVSGDLLAAGDLRAGRNAVVPSSIEVNFPIYADSPVPHLMNSRYANQRPSSWFEDSLGDLYMVIVPVASGGANVSGLVGISSYSVQSTAKALFSSEVVASGTALNHSGLAALASQIAVDRYNAQVLGSLDEVYPGTLAWEPEGLHDIVWTYSERSRLAGARVMRTDWNTMPTEFQHSAPALSGSTNVPRGVGGQSVAQTIRDSVSGNISTVLVGTFGSGTMQAFLDTTAYLPTQNRWRGLVYTSGAAGSGQITNSEIVLFEGTSGDPSFVQVVQRGIDGTLITAHGHGDIVQQVLPNVNYGTNLITYEKAEFVYPAEWTSGGIAGLAKVPQNQSVICLADAPATINSIEHWSGQVQLYNTAGASGGQFPDRELVWLVERNAASLTSGCRYQGQLAGYSASGPVAPVYLVSEGGSGASTGANLRVRVATTEAVDLFGIQRIDGVQLVADDRVLVKDQSNSAANGIYVVSASNWNRSADFSTAAQVVCMALIEVEEGSLWGSTEWRLVTPDPITIGLSGLDFRKLAPLGTKTPGSYMQTSQKVRLTASEVGLQGTVGGATNASPIVIFSPGHPLSGGETITVSGVKGNTAANGTWTITVIDANNFSLNTSVGNGAYVSGGEWGNWSFAANIVTTPSLTAMDGIVLVNGDLVLLRFPDHLAAGVYTVTNTLAGTFTRDVNYDGSADFYCGLQIYVNEGTSYNQTVWRLMTPDTITLNTSPQQWMQWPEFFEGRQSNVRLTARHDLTITPIVHRLDNGRDSVEWVFDAQFSGGPQSGLVLLTCQDDTGTPSYSGIDTLRANKARGMVWTNPLPGIAKFDQLVQNSIVALPSGLQFENDQFAPGPLFAYMTDSGGTKGWNQLTGASGIINIFNIINIFVTNIYLSGTIIIMGSGGPISGVIQIIQDEGTDLAFKPKINFVGPRVNAIETATAANNVIVDVNYFNRNANFLGSTDAETLYGIDASTGPVTAALVGGAIPSSHPILHFYLKNEGTGSNVLTVTGLIGPDRFLSDEGQYLSVFWNGSDWLPCAQGPVKVYGGDGTVPLAYQPRLAFFDGVKAADDTAFFSTDASLNISGLGQAVPGSGAVFAFYESGPLHRKAPLNFIRPVSGLAGAWNTQNVLVSGYCSGGNLVLQSLVMNYPSGLIYFT